MGGGGSDLHTYAEVRATSQASLEFFGAGIGLP
jgi:hypothetical protein